VGLNSPGLMWGSCGAEQPRAHVGPGREKLKHWGRNIIEQKIMDACAAPRTTVLELAIEVDSPGSTGAAPGGALGVSPALTFVLLCDHCGEEYTELGAPMACGCNICDCRCAALYCPAFDLRSHTLKYCNVLNELMDEVPEFDAL